MTNNFIDNDGNVHFTISMNLRDLVEANIEDSLGNEEVYEFNLVEQVEYALQRRITNQYLSKNIDSIADKINKAIELKMGETIDSEITKLVESAMTEGKYKIGYSNTPMTLEEYVEKKLGEYRSSIDNTITKLGQKYADKLKDRYDLLFASSIVGKLSDNKMLKDDVAKLLFDDLNPKGE